MVLIFALYEFTVQRRQKTVLASVAKASALVSSLFPKEVQEPMLRKEKKHEEAFLLVIGLPMKHQIKDFLKDSDETTAQGALSKPWSPPIADLYPSASVIFADMVGCKLKAAANNIESFPILIPSRRHQLVIGS
jgi:hypothetical protein